MALFLTGDIHGWADIIKLERSWFDRSGLTRDDYMVILGDFGLIWHDPPTEEEQRWLNWLERCPWTTLVVLGNHENYGRILKMPTEPWQGGKIRRFNEHVWQLVDNEIFEIDGQTFFVRGGAHSVDRAWRTAGVSWWPEEVPDDAERQAAMDRLDAVNWRVDYVLTHECPQEQYYALHPHLRRSLIDQDEYAGWLQAIAKRLEFKRWFFGHHHEDRYDLGRYTALLNSISTLDGTPSERIR